MIIKRLITKLLPLSLLAATLTGCSDEGTPTEAITLYDIVRLEAVSDAGSEFSLCKPHSDNEIRYYAEQAVDTAKVSVGNSLQIAYTTVSGEAYKSGKINLLGYAAITNAELYYGDNSDISGWDKDPVYLLSAWRSGRSLYIYARLPYDRRPRRLALVRDTTDTSSAASPAIYLVHSLKDEINTFDRAYFMAFDISALTDDTTLDAFTLRLNNSNLRLDSIPFPLR